MEYILLIVATLCATGKTLACKKLGTPDQTGKRSKLYFKNSLIFLTATIPVLIANLINDISALFTVSLFSLLLALVFGGIMVYSQTTEIKAMELGSASLTALIYALGLLIPIIYGRVFLKEDITLIQYLGMALIILALVFIISPKKDGRLGIVWLLFSLLAMVGSGGAAVVQKIHQSSEYKGELLPFIFVSLLFASLLFAVLGFTMKIKEVEYGDKTAKNVSVDCEKASTYPSKTDRIKNVAFILLSGTVIGGVHIINLFLAGKLPAVIQFPIYNLGNMILVGVLSSIIFKDRITRSQLIGFAVGCVAILMLGLGG